MKITTPKRNLTTLEKLRHYDTIIDNGLDVDELKEVRKKIYRIETYNTEERIEKDVILQCIKEFLKESNDKSSKKERMQEMAND